MLRVNIHLGTNQMFSLSGSINAGSNYRMSDMEANTAHSDLTQLTEMERKLREAREKSNERIDQDTLAELNKPKPAPKKPGAEDGEEGAPDEEGGDTEEGAAAPADGGDSEEGDEEFE